MGSVRSLRLLGLCASVLLMLSCVSLSACPGPTACPHPTGSIQASATTVSAGSPLTFTATNLGDQDSSSDECLGGLPDAVVAAGLTWTFFGEGTIAGDDQVEYTWYSCGEKEVILTINDVGPPQYTVNDDPWTTSIFIKVLPPPVTGFTAVPGDTITTLTWTNPNLCFTGTRIMFKTTGYPTGPNDGEQVYEGTGHGTVAANLTNGVDYYYTAFTYTLVGSNRVYSGPVNALLYDTWYVKQGVTQPQTPQPPSWETAFPAINNAINLTTAGYDIWVAGSSTSSGAVYSEKVVVRD